MRITTSMSYELATSAIQRQQATVAKINQQLAAGTRLLSPSDDPIATNNAMRVKESLARNDQFAENRSLAASTLVDLESTLQGASDVIARIKDLALSAGNASMSDAERRFLATEIRGRLDDLMGLANRKDAYGNHMFAGYQSEALPFARSTSGSIQYLGDSGQRFVLVDADRQMNIAFSGSDVFEGMRNGNGSFATSSVTTNAGTGIISGGRVVDASALTNGNYEIQFSVASGVTTYSVQNTTTGALVSSGNPFTSGAAILVDGMRMEVSGAPANGDRFAIEPSRNESIFVSIERLVAALERPVNSGADKAQLSNALGQSYASFDMALEHVIDKRAQVGTGLAELDSLNVLGERSALNDKTRLSNLTDLDYAKAISDLAQEQMKIDAARQAFVKTQGLSLFSLL
jgi:flagellar hook-associated protein 3 FlgL